jgi:hypothetical protein
VEPPVQPTPESDTYHIVSGTEPASQPTDLGREGVFNGYFESERFNVRFAVPVGWEVVSQPWDDSVLLAGPDGIQMVVANSFSVQLVDANFQQLNDRVSFDNVNLLPDRMEARPINGMATYRVEGDALLRGDNVSIYFISQVISLPGSIVMATLFIPGDNFYLHSDEMRAVLDSVEALDLRPE